MHLYFSLQPFQLLSPDHTFSLQAPASWRGSRFPIRTYFTSYPILHGMRGITLRLCIVHALRVAHGRDTIFALAGGPVQYRTFLPSAWASRTARLPSLSVSFRKFQWPFRKAVKTKMRFFSPCLTAMPPSVYPCFIGLLFRFRSFAVGSLPSQRTKCKNMTQT